MNLTEIILHFSIKIVPCFSKTSMDHASVCFGTKMVPCITSNVSVLVKFIDEIKYLLEEAMYSELVNVYLFLIFFFFY